MASILPKTDIEHGYQKYFWSDKIPQGPGREWTKIKEKKIGTWPQRQDCGHKLIVSHSHSWGPAMWLVDSGEVVDVADRVVVDGLMDKAEGAEGAVVESGLLVAVLDVSLDCEVAASFCRFLLDDLEFALADLLSPVFAISTSFCDRELLALLCLRARRGAAVGRDKIEDVGAIDGFGGPGAIGTTVFTGFSAVLVLVGVCADEPAVDAGESDSLTDCFAGFGVVAGG